MSYIKFLNLMEAVKGLPTYPSLDAVEERLLNTFAVLWNSRVAVTVLQAMEMLQDASPATVHRRLKTLYEKGYIELQPDEADKRVKYIKATALTDKYFARLEDCLAKAQQ